MRYEEYQTLGEVTTIKEYEGTPQEIAQLIGLFKQKGEETEPATEKIINKPPIPDKREDNDGEER